MRRFPVVLLVIAGVVTSSAGPAAARADDPTWTKVASGATGNISGLAPAASGWIAVRDNKKAGQNRIALVASAGGLTELAWPGVPPQDLESVAAVPGQPGQYAALTSAGAGTIVAVDGTNMSVVRQFSVPRGSGIEGLSLTAVGTTTVAVWATRGSTTAPARVFAATFAPSSGVFGPVSATKVTVPYPTTNVRQVSDLTVVGGRLIGASTSDPGSNGPFASALYDLGAVTLTSGRAHVVVSPPAPLGRFDGHKVEGIACSGAQGLLGSDDEKQGGWIAPADFCG